VIQPMLHLHECAEPLHYVGDSAAIKEYVVEPLHSAADPTTAKSAAEPLQSIADSDNVADAPTETSCS
jgi:hypothetical protein